MTLPAGSAILVIYNAHSGAQADAHFKDLLLEKSKQYSFTYQVYELEKEGCEGSIIRLITTFKPDLLIAAGGDGTLNIVAKIAPDFNLPVLILPYGSANGMARELAIPNHIPEAFDLLANYKTNPVDVLNINDFTCVHLADVGLNARIVKRFSQDKRRGLITYARYLWTEVFLISSRRFIIHYDGKIIRRKAVSITFANASKYGTGAVINPTGVIDDGKFELCIVKPFPKLKIFSLAWKMFRGTLQSSEYFEVVSSTNAIITTRKGIGLQIDGEVIGKVKRIEVGIKPQALKLLLPVIS